MVDHPVCIQQLVKSLLQYHKRIGSEEEYNDCYQIVVETQDRDRLLRYNGIAGEDRSSPDWVETLRSEFQVNDCHPQWIQTLPQNHPQQLENCRTKSNNFHQTWKERRRSQNVEGPRMMFHSTTTTTSTTTVVKAQLPVVKVLDSVVPLMYHCVDWKETLTIIGKIQKSCHVLILRVQCDALSQQQVQSIEASASAIIFENVLLRRGVQEHDQWLREDLLRLPTATTSTSSKKDLLETATDTIPNQTRSKIFLESNDPDSSSELFGDYEDPDDDLDL